MSAFGLTIKSIGHGNLCHGWHWVVSDENVLATQVARVALGQYRHVARVLAGAADIPPLTHSQQIANVEQLLTLKPGEKPWHRDGWLFQTISWIAAHQTSTEAIIRLPHLIKAHKGFDGFQLELSKDSKKVTAVIIFEDKATKTPRKMISDDVWPSIETLEKGERVSELVQEATALLESQQAARPGLDITDAINSIIWKEARHYRVSVTVGDDLLSDNERSNLFSGYDAKAPGHLKRRQADTFHLNSLRAWMESFAALVIAKAKEV